MTVYIQDTAFPNSSGFDFQDVSWLTLSPDGTQIYFLQRASPCVTIWDLKGNHLRNWTTDELGCPHSLTFRLQPDGSYRVWITDMAPPTMTGNDCGHCIKEFDMAGNYLGSIGTCGPDTQGTGIDPVQFDKVTDVAYDNNGYMWVTDGDIDGLNNRVLQINPYTQQVVQVWSAPNNQPGSGPKEFNLPHSIDIDDLNRIWIADALNCRVQIITTDGTVLQELKCFGDYGVYGVCVRTDPTSGKRQLFVSTSPTSSPTGGIVKIFDVATSGTPVPGDCVASYQWSVELPVGTSTRMLHMIEATASGDQVFLAPLGGDLKPVKYVKVYAPE